MIKITYYKFCFIIYFMLIIVLFTFNFLHANNNHVVIAQKGDVISLNPWITSDYASSSVYNRIFNGLFKYDENMKIILSLASDYSVTLNQIIYLDTNEITTEKFLDFENKCKDILNNLNLDDISKDELKNIKVVFNKINESTIKISLNTFSLALCKVFESCLDIPIFKINYKPQFDIFLKQNVKWHDNVPFTSDDVIFTYNTVMKMTNLPVYDSFNINSIESVEKISDLCVRFVFKYPSSRIFESLQLPILPYHKLNGQDIINARFNMMPIGTGPFKFLERAIDDYIVLIRNENYFQDIPKIEKITFRIIPNESMMFLELLQGNVDIMQLKPDQFVKFTNTPEFEKNFIKIRYPEREYTYIGWNLKNDLFSDINVRKALCLAINKELLIEKILYNLGQVCNGPFYPTSWANNPNIKNLPYDPKLAIQLLKEAGWNYNKNNILEKQFLVKSFFGYDDTNEIRQFEFKLLINAGNKERELCAKFIANELSKIGIKVIIEVLDWKDFIKLIDNTQFDAFILTWMLGYDPDISSIWHSSNIPNIKKGKYGLNSVSYKNLEVDRLLDEARQTIDRTYRMKCYHKIHEIIMSEQPYCFLYTADTLYAVSKKIKNIKPSQVGILSSIEKWVIE